MSSSQGWFESDEDYQRRVADEANERIIEDSSGSAPRQGWLESDDDYRERIAREASEHIIEDSTGAAPRQGWLEDDRAYAARVAREANERIVHDSTGEAPKQGWLEDDQAYDTRVRQEANERILADRTGDAPKQAWLEGDHDYRSRIAREGREARLHANRESSSSGVEAQSTISNLGGYPSAPAPTSWNWGGIVLLLISGVTALGLLMSTGSAPSTPVPQDGVAQTGSSMLLSTIPEFVAPEHAVVLRSWLRKNPRFRVADYTDCRCDEDLPAIRDAYANHDIYYVAADFNDDGATDFAVVLIDKSKHPENAVKALRHNADGTSDYGFDSFNGWNAALAIFNGPFTPNDTPALLAETVGAPVGALLFYREAERQLLVGKWESDGRLVVASQNTYVLR